MSDTAPKITLVIEPDPPPYVSPTREALATVLAQAEAEGVYDLSMRDIVRSVLRVRRGTYSYRALSQWTIELGWARYEVRTPRPRQGWKVKVRFRLLAAMLDGRVWPGLVAPRKGG